MFSRFQSTRVFEPLIRGDQRGLNHIVAFSPRSAVRSLLLPDYAELASEFRRGCGNNGGWLKTPDRLVPRYAHLFEHVHRRYFFDEDQLTLADLCREMQVSQFQCENGEISLAFWRGDNHLAWQYVDNDCPRQVLVNNVTVPHALAARQQDAYRLPGARLFFQKASALVPVEIDRIDLRSTVGGSGNIGEIREHFFAPHGSGALSLSESILPARPAVELTF